VGVPDQPVALQTDDLQELGVHLEVHGAEDHVHADLLHLPGPEDVVRLVELRPELHEHGDVLAVLLGAHERLDDGRVLAYPVEAYLDGLDVRVVGCLVHEPDDGAEGLVGVVEYPVPGPDGLEDVHALGQLRRGVGLEGLVLELGVVEADYLPEVLREDLLGAVDLQGGQPQVPAEHLDHVVGHLGLDDHPDREADVPVVQGLLHGGHEVARLVYRHLDVRVAGDPEGVRALDRQAGEQRRDVVLDDILDEDVGLFPLGLGGDLDEPREHARGHLDPGVHVAVVVPALELDGDVEDVVGDERERVGHVERQRGEQRVHPLPVELGHPCALVWVELGYAHDAYPLVRELGPEGHPAQLVLGDEVPYLLGDLLHEAVVIHAGVVRAGDRVLLHDAGDADHEELVHVRMAYGQELDALQQGVGFLERLVQAPAVEPQPGDLPVDVVLLVVEVHGLVGCGLLTPRHRPLS
jgi:hypothetical protein